MPKAAGLLLALLLAIPALPAGAQTQDADAPQVRVAVIDTGIAPAHREFAPGQVVAWWDFTTERKGPLMTDPYRFAADERAWDPFVAPFDPVGHGTATASLVAGRNADDCGAGARHEKLSFAAGAPLVVAKVARVGDLGEPVVSGDVGLALRWAVDQGARVVSISLGTIVPLPVHLDASDLAYAQRQGALVVVAAGNGLGNTGLAPFPAWTGNYGNSPHVLSVGGGERDGRTLHTTTGNLDPDVTSWSERVCAATPGGGYARMTGTSFAAPLVAGLAAAAIDVARAHGQPHDAERLERLLLLSGTNDPLSPYAREGTGFVLDEAWATVRAHAALGTLPAPDARGAHAMLDLYYHDVVLERGKRTPFL